MTPVEFLLGCIFFILCIIWMYIRWIYLKIEYGKVFDVNASTNCYGEGLVDGIQNAIVRGQRGIATYE